MSAAVDGDAVALHPYLLIFPSVADVLPGGVVVAAVYLSYPRSIEVHRDRRALARVPYPVEAPSSLLHDSCQTFSSGGRDRGASYRYRPGARSALRARTRWRSSRLPRRSGRGSWFGFPQARQRPAGSTHRPRPRGGGRRTNLVRISLLPERVGSATPQSQDPSPNRTGRKRLAAGPAPREDRKSFAVG